MGVIMKNRKQIVKDMDQLIHLHFDNAVNKDKKQRSLSSKIASYILKVPCCGHGCCCFFGGEEK